MAVRIEHASIDENGAATGGAAGNQTGKELCTREWYTKGWNVLLAKEYELPKFGADGDFGAETENALLLYQEDMNIKPDAKYGHDTWSALLGLTGVG